MTQDTSALDEYRRLYRDVLKWSTVERIADDDMKAARRNHRAAQREADRARAKWVDFIIEHPELRDVYPKRLGDHAAPTLGGHDGV